MSDWSKPLFVTGIISSSFLSGAITSLSLLTIPALLRHPTPLPPSTLTTWSHIYNLGARLAPALALFSASTFFLSAYATYAPTAPPRRLRGFVVAGVAVLGIVPWTLLVMRGVNGELFAREKRGDDGDEEGVREALSRWAWWNAGRGVLVAVGTLVAFDASFARGVLG